MKDKKELLREIMVLLSKEETEQADKLIEVFLNYIPEISPEEITEVAQELEDQNIFKDAEKHLDIEVKIFQVINQKIPKRNLNEFTKGHPLHTFLEENREIELLGERAWVLLDNEDSYTTLRSDWLLIAKQYKNLELHYLRKENQLFPFLEKRGFSHASTIMWSIDDIIRKLIKEFRIALENDDKEEAFKILPDLKREADEMIIKEEKVLFPTAARLLTEQDWKEIRNGEDEVGWIIAEPPKEWKAIEKLGSYLKSSPERIETIMNIMTDFFNGKDMSYLTGRFESELQGEISPGEFALAEQKVEKYGISNAQFEGKIDELIKIFKSSLDNADIKALPEGHPLDSFIKENAAIKKLITKLREKEKNIDIKNIDISFWTESYDMLWQINTHYVRKENQLFPYLEKKGFDKPSMVMWALHDDIRALIKFYQSLLEEKNYEELFGTQELMFTAVIDMIFKEEKILWPTSLELISNEEWTQIRAGEKEVGYCLIDEPPMWSANKWKHPHQESEFEEIAVKNKSLVGGINLDVGSITPEQINLIFKHMPFDVTYVDEFDEVRYYNKGEERVFPRSPGIIGRELRYCHPPKSVHMVLQIVEAFKNGTKNTADFWINFNDKFVFIQYFAVRDNQGHYKGVLEITYDGTRLRSLEGDQQLLDWEEE